MASKSGDSSDNVEKVLLEERDIPGAELPRPAERCTKAYSIGRFLVEEEKYRRRKSIGKPNRADQKVSFYRSHQ